MGLELFSRILGQNKKHLIILHGLLGSADNWQTIGKKYANDFTVHLVDARNHGRSPHSKEHSYDLMVEDLLLYLDQNNIQKAHLLGHSMGGKAVMAFAEKHPERVSKLIVADIAPKKYTPHHGPIFDALLGTNPSDAVSREEVQSFLESRINSDDTFIQFLMKGLYRNREGGYKWRFNVESLAKNLDGVTEEIQISINTIATLFIRGLNSKYVSDQDFEKIETYYMQLETSEIEGAGHWLHAEKPEEFYEITIEFLR